MPHNFMYVCKGQGKGATSATGKRMSFTSNAPRGVGKNNSRTDAICGHEKATVLKSSPTLIHCSIAFLERVVRLELLAFFVLDAVYVLRVCHRAQIFYTGALAVFLSLIV